jgi:hypothetical protein
MAANVGVKPLTSELNYQNRNMPIDEGLRSTVDPKTGEYKKGWIRSIGNALGILRDPITKKNYYQQQRVHDEIDAHNSEVRSKEAQNAQARVDSERENIKNKEQYQNTVKTWAREHDEGKGKIKPELDHATETQRARDVWRQEPSRRHEDPRRGSWVDEEDAVEDAVDRVNRRSDEITAAKKWREENPRPEEPDYVEPKIVDPGNIRVKKIGQNPRYTGRMFGDTPVDMNESIEKTIKKIILG